MSGYLEGKQLKSSKPRWLSSYKKGVACLRSSNYFDMANCALLTPLEHAKAGLESATIMNWQTLPTWLYKRPLTEYPIGGC